MGVVVRFACKHPHIALLLYFPIEVALDTVGQFDRGQVQLRVAASRQIGGMFVAGVAAVRGIGCGVACFTVDFALAAMIEREGMAFKQGRAPALDGMAVIAALTKEPGMNGRFFVALGAARRSAAVLFVLVAGFALQIGMLVFQWKSNLMVKTVQAVDAVVASQAVVTVLLDMFLHKRLVVGGVT